VDYVFTHPYYWLFIYHQHILAEMQFRGYHFDYSWTERTYRGKSIGNDTSRLTDIEDSKWREGFIQGRVSLPDYVIYPEHDETYLAECIENLARKGVHINLPTQKSSA